jgi:hypothetical protein
MICFAGKCKDPHPKSRQGPVLDKILLDSIGCGSPGLVLTLLEQTSGHSWDRILADLKRPLRPRLIKKLPPFIRGRRLAMHCRTASILLCLALDHGLQGSGVGLSKERLFDQMSSTNGTTICSCSKILQSSVGSSSVE